MRCDDPRLERLLARSLDDLESLRLTDAADSGRHLRRRRRAVVSDPVRSGQHLGGPDDAAAGHRARRGHPADARPPAGATVDDCLGRGAREDHARAAPRRRAAGRADRPLAGDPPATYYGTVDATLLWISLLADAWRWGLADDGRRRPAAQPAPGPGLAGATTATPTGTASSSTSTPPVAAWPTRGGRTRATRSGSTTAAWAGRRSRCARCRRTRTGPRSTRRHCSTPSADPATEGDRWRDVRGRRWPTGSGPGSGSTDRWARSRRWPSTATAGRSTR